MTKSDNQKPYAGLTNQELVMIYDKFKTYLDEVNSKLDNNQIHERVFTPMGEGIKIHRLSNDQVDEFKNTEYYQFSTSIVEKLAPIKELIMDGAPDQLVNITD